MKLFGVDGLLMAVRKNRTALPLAVFDSLAAAAEWSGMQEHAVYSLARTNWYRHKDGDTVQAYGQERSWTIIWVPDARERDTVRMHYRTFEQARWAELRLPAEETHRIRLDEADGYELIYEEG